MASRSVNKVFLLGNLTRDPELKYTPSGTAICTFGVATNRSWSTATGEVREDVQFHRILAWQKLAELCHKILAKGRRIYLEGRITYRTFVGKDGVQRTITEIVLDDFVVCDDKRKTEATVEELTPTEAPEAEVTPDIIPTPEETKEEEKEESAHKKKTAKKEKEENIESEDVNPDEIDIPF